MTTIHPTAIVDPAAQLADDIAVGPFTVIGPHVSVGSGTTIGSHCVIEGRTTIGIDNRISHHVTIGQNPQDLKYKGEPTTLTIGDRNDIRENVTIHIGTENGGGTTIVGNDNLLMVGSHIAHDCVVGNHVILANNTMLAGHVLIDDHAIVSGGAAISHYVTIGQYAFVGGLSGVVHDCPPFLISDGHPNRPKGVNIIGLNRHAFEQETIDKLKRVSIALFGQKARRNNNFNSTLDSLDDELIDNEQVKLLTEFVRRSAATPNGRYAETLRKDNKRTTPTQ